MMRRTWPTLLVALWIEGASAQQADSPGLVSITPPGGETIYLNPSQVTPVSAPNHAQWHVRTEKSQIDDSENVFLWLTADTPIIVRYQNPIYPSLFIACRENRTDLGVSFDIFLSSSDLPVTTRIDDAKAVTRDWNYSTDFTAVLTYRPIALIQQLFGHKKFLVKVTPYGEAPVMTTFKIEGIEDVIAPLRGACHW